MADSGFTYETRLDPANRDWPEPRPSKGEEAVALGDRECRAVHGMTAEALRTIETGIQARLVGDMPLDLPELTDRLQVLIDAAAA